MLAVVTGAGVRVGRAIAVALADAGYDLALHANDSIVAATELAAELAKKGRQASVHKADLGDPAQVEGLAKVLRDRYHVIDLLVNSASIYVEEPFADIGLAAYARMQQINLTAPFFLTQGLLEPLKHAASPSVINIVDIAAERVVPRYAHYTVTKAGLAALTKALATELAPKIRVNGVSPGLVATPAQWTEATKSGALERIPLQRSGHPEDVAKLVVFLARDATYMTGQIVAVDGGWSAAL
jgi:pteridine reductase